MITTIFAVKSVLAPTKFVVKSVSAPTKFIVKSVSALTKFAVIFVIKAYTQLYKKDRSCFAV